MSFKWMIIWVLRFLNKMCAKDQNLNSLNLHHFDSCLICLCFDTQQNKILKESGTQTKQKTHITLYCLLHRTIDCLQLPRTRSYSPHLWQCLSNENITIFLWIVGHHRSVYGRICTNPSELHFINFSMACHCHDPIPFDQHSWTPCLKTAVISPHSLSIHFPYILH